VTGPLRAVVVGAGWAGEGHTRALHWCNVVVVAICSRQQAVVRAVADRLALDAAAAEASYGLVQTAGVKHAYAATQCYGPEVAWLAELVRDFVAGIRGEPHRPYLTLRDGWRDQVSIDAIRTGSGWTALPR
jgi:hypothetical protein